MDELIKQLNDAFDGRYCIERQLGRGAMATVYLSQERHPARQVAIKVLEPALAHELGRGRFLREVDIASNLTHPHIVPIFGAGEAAGLLYYVMPYIEGESLRARLLRETSLPIDDAIHIAHDVADALDYAHGSEVVHRDIKPENILLAGGHGLVTDFGIARALCAACSDNLTIAGIPIGTPGYMSPEQASGMVDVDGRSDIYSLACVVYETLRGKPPFSGTTLMAIREAQRQPLSRMADFGNGIPDAVEAALRRALSVNPAERFANAGEFAAALVTGRGPHGARRTQPSLTSTPRETSPKSIAVLPFANMSPDPENEFFSDGMTDDIITNLSRIPDLRVISRTSVMRFKHTDKSLDEIGHALDVGTVLQGSVRRVGNRVRIVSQLIDVGTDAHLWAETYDRDLTDVFEIQSDVAGHIARALEATLSPGERARIEKKPTENLDAYNLHLKGNFYWTKFTPDAARKALQCFHEAIDLDPGFALAHMGLANAYFFIGTGLGPLSAKDAFQRAKQAAERALELDDTIPDAHATLGSVHAWCGWDWAAAEAEFERADELCTGCDHPHVKYGFYLAAIGCHDEALGRAKKALAFDPVSLIVNSYLGLQRYWARQFDEAVEQLLRAVELDERFPPARDYLGWTYLTIGRVDEAIGQFERVLGIAGRVPTSVAGLGSAYAAAGRKEDAMRMVRELGDAQAFGDHYVSPRDLALVQTWLGQNDVALDSLERACQERAAWMSFINVDPVWDALRPAPRFQAIVRKIGLSQ